MRGDTCTDKNCQITSKLTFWLVCFHGSVAWGLPRQLKKAKFWKVIIPTHIYTAAAFHFKGCWRDQILKFIIPTYLRCSISIKWHHLCMTHGIMHRLKKYTPPPPNPPKRKLKRKINFLLSTHSRPTNSFGYNYESSLFRERKAKLSLHLFLSTFSFLTHVRLSSWQFLPFGRKSSLPGRSTLPCRPSWCGWSWARTPCPCTSACTCSSGSGPRRSWTCHTHSKITFNFLCAGKKKISLRFSFVAVVSKITFSFRGQGISLFQFCCCCC